MDHVSSGHLGDDSNAEREKFVIDAEVPVDAGAPLPDNYGEDRLVILPRDPFWFFTYWEITPENSERVRRDFGQDIWEKAALVLRVYDLAASGTNMPESAPFFDVEVSKQTRQWYVKTQTPGHNYVVDLGLRWPDGRFVSLIRSNRIHLPQGRVSDVTDAAWMSITGVLMTAEEWNKVFKATDPGGVAGGPGSAVGSAEFAQSMAQRWEFLKSVSSGNWLSSFGGMPSSPTSSWSKASSNPEESKR